VDHVESWLGDCAAELGAGAVVATGTSGVEVEAERAKDLSVRLSCVPSRRVSMMRVRVYNRKWIFGAFSLSVVLQHR